jgi:small basic protein
MFAVELKEMNRTIIALLLLGTIALLVASLFLPVSLPYQYAPYVAVGFLTVLDSLFGALRGDLVGDFNWAIFWSGIVFNILVGVSIAYLGFLLGLELYLGVVVFYTWRLIENVRAIRYTLLAPWLSRRRIEEEIEKE